MTKQDKIMSFHPKITHIDNKIIQEKQFILDKLLRFDNAAK